MNEILFLEEMIKDLENHIKAIRRRIKKLQNDTPPHLKRWGFIK